MGVVGDLAGDGAFWRGADVSQPRAMPSFVSSGVVSVKVVLLFTALRGRPTPGRPFNGVKTMRPLAS